MNKQELEKSLIAFTDGSSLGNPGPGGWGAILILPRLSEIIELGGSKQKTTNNEMELEAIVSILTYSINNTDPLHIFTDSKYAINGITSWMYNWSKNGWKTQNNEQIKNIFQWKTIYQYIQERGKEKVFLHYVPGHIGIVGNERADEIARGLAENLEIKLYRGNIERYDYKEILSFDYQEEKKEIKDIKNKKAYSYLSVVDDKLERHTTWSQCEDRVKGKKAKFKKTISQTHENEIMEEWGFKKEK